MAAPILSQLMNDLNENINSHADLETKLLQAESIALVGESFDLSQLEGDTLQHYFLNLQGLIEESKQLCESLSQDLIRMVSELKSQTDSS